VTEPHVGYRLVEGNEPPKAVDLPDRER
jgi:hypothetical protein